MNADDFSFATMRSHISGIAWPPISTGPSAALAALLAQLDHSQWLDPAALRARQFGQLRALAEHCAAHSPFFARRLRGAGLTPALLATAHGFASLPLMRRHDIQTATDLYCEALPPDHAPVHESRTSGSTGEPICVRRTAITQLMWSAHLMRDQLWHRRDLTARQCAIRANVDELVKLDSWGGNAGGLFETGELYVIPLARPIAELVVLIDAYRPDSLLVYPNVIAGLLEDCRARGRGFEGLRHIRAVGESLSPTLRRDAAAFFGARITDSYSSQEIGYITLECPDAETHHVMAETVILELLRDDGSPCREGEIGRVVITDLHNFATPMIRYDVGDYAEFGPPCSCGRGLPTLSRVVGRERNLMRLADGSRRWPLVGGHHYRDIAPVRQFQLIQHGFDDMEVRLVCDRPIRESEEAALRALILKSLGHDFRLDLRYFEDRLPTGANGKFDEFVCAMAAS